MAHKAMVDGTLVELSGGRALVDATAYDIKQGRVLIDGTEHDIPFTRIQTVEITGSPDDLRGFIRIGDSRISNVGTYEFETDGNLEIYVAVSSSDLIHYVSYATITLNGENVGKTEIIGSTYAVVSYTLQTSAQNIRINFKSKFAGYADGEKITCLHAEITTS